MFSNHLAAKRLAFCSSLLALSAAARHAGAQEFTVLRVADDSVAYTGTLSAESENLSTGIPVRLADFSALDEPGEYYVVVPEIGRSVSFRIGPDVYDGELAHVMLGFYGWRSGVDISFDAHGVHYEHAAGHLDDALLDYVDGQVGVRRDGSGGWYDAGDYGKYLPTASIAVNTMLTAWELFSDKLALLELPFIPEHGGELPDYLDEIKFELDWVLKMAYADGSGRVHHKLNSPRFPGFVLPADDPTTRYFSSFSTAATAEFVATMAMAARVFAPYDAVTGGYSETLLTAAQTAYAYLTANPGNVPYDISVLSAGAYEKGDTEDRRWAAAEIWETTGDPAALADFETRSSALTRITPNFDWDRTSNFGVLTYVLSQRTGRDPETAERLTQGLIEVADLLVVLHGRSGYGRNFENYYWGTNGVLARTCMLLQAANVVAPNPAYLDVCADQIGYLYGRNQYNRSQVTGAGIDPPLQPHHRISGADAVEAPYPGLLVGGGQNAVNWQDLQSSFSTNEVAINWSAALVFALAGFFQGSGDTASLGRGPVAAADCGVRLNSIGFVSGRTKVATVQSDCEVPSLFQCDMQSHTMGGDTSGPLFPIDDLEDGNLQILPLEGRVGSWGGFDDGSGGTRTEPTITPAGGSGSKNAVCISGQGFTGWGGGIGFPLADRQPYDASTFTGVSFKARGSTTQFRLMLTDKYSEPAAALCSSCNDHFNFTFTPTSEWQEYTFSWTQARQISFGDPQPSVCPSALYAMQFQWPSNSEFELCVDDVAFTTAAGTPGPSGGGQDLLASGGGGCGCRVGPQAASRWGVAAAVGLLGLWFAGRQRRRSREFRRALHFGVVRASAHRRQDAMHERGLDLRA